MTFLRTPATTLPLGLDELKAHLNYPADISSQDGDLSAKLNTAVSAIEDATGRVLIKSTAVLNLAHWPCGEFLELPGGQTSSITSVKYTAAGASAQTTWAATNYKLVRGYSLSAATQVVNGLARLQLAWGAQWPTETLDTGEPIEITYEAGWKDADSVPFQLKAAVLIKAEVLYWRDPIRTGADAAALRLERMEYGIGSLVSPFVIWNF